MTNKMTTIKALKAACLMALAALAAAPAFATFSPSDIVAQDVYDSRYVIAQSSVPGAGNESMAIRLFYTGTATEAVVTINATGVLVYAPNAVLDTTFPAGALTAALYPTIGQLCDAFNKTSNYQCRMEDARRSDPFAYLAGVTAASTQGNLKAIGGYPVGFAPGGNAAFSVYGSTWISLGINPPADTRVILKKCVFQGLGVGYVRLTVSGLKRAFEGAPDGVVRDDSRVIWASTSAVTTATTVSWDSSGVGGISFAMARQGISGPSTGLPGGMALNQPTVPNTLGRVVVRVDSDGGTSTQQNATDYLNCEWTYRGL